MIADLSEMMITCQCHHHCILSLYLRLTHDIDYFGSLAELTTFRECLDNNNDKIDDDDILSTNDLHSILSLLD